jgi:hypothetical protein
LIKTFFNSLVTFILLFLFSSCTNIPQSIKDKNIFSPSSKNEIYYKNEFEIDQNLKQLEEFESYRPNSCSDMSRNPFGVKRYNYIELKNSIRK